MGVFVYISRPDLSLMYDYGEIFKYRRPVSHRTRRKLIYVVNGIVDAVRFDIDERKRVRMTFKLGAMIKRRAYTYGRSASWKLTFVTVRTSNLS